MRGDLAPGAHQMGRGAFVVESGLLEVLVASGGAGAERVLRWLVEGAPMRQQHLVVDVAWSSGEVAL